MFEPWSAKTCGLGVQAMVETSSVPEKRLTCDGMLQIIERDLEIGDSIMAGRRLGRWSACIVAEMGTQGRERLDRAKSAFEELVAYEASHGRFSRLDRQSREIVLYERGARQLGLRSIYGATPDSFSQRPTIAHASS
jgi:hypothetical protein